MAQYREHGNEQEIQQREVQAGANEQNSLFSDMLSLKEFILIMQFFMSAHFIVQKGAD